MEKAAHETNYYRHIEYAVNQIKMYTLQFPNLLL